MAGLPHEIVTVLGTTGSGKTRLIARSLGPRHARRITLDTVGECETLYPNAFQAFGIQAVYDAMNAWAAEGLSTWHLVATLDDDETGELMRKLCPKHDGKTEALSRTWGGVCVECFEVDEYLHISGRGGEMNRAWQNAVKRGRHVGLSLLCATRQPAECSRLLTSQSHHVISFAMHEPNDLRWLALAGGQQFAKIAHTGLRQYESVWYSTRTHRIVIRDKNYAVKSAAGDLFADPNAGART
jgi:hypothetical protein